MERWTTEEVKRRLDSGEDVTVIDARSPESWAKADAQIANSIRVPPDRTGDFVAAIPKDAVIVTYCT